MERVTFRSKHSYSSDDQGISVPIRLYYGSRGTELSVKVDTGSAHCLFKREYALELNIPIEHGEPLKMASLVGDPILMYGHDVILRVLDIDFHVTAYFPGHHHNIRRNVLGRGGWLTQARLGIVDHDQLLYLSHYDD